MATDRGPLMVQHRAGHALKVVGRALVSQDPVAYRRHARHLGPAILMNGLGQALATAAANKDSKQLYKDLREWLCDACPWTRYRGAPDLITAIAQGDRSAYMWATEESLAWLEWVKKLAVARIPGEERE